MMTLRSVMGRTRNGRWLVAALVSSVAAIVFVSYRAVGEWQRSAAALAERRADATVNLLVTALVQDMRAVQVTVLSDQSPDVTDNTPVDRYDVIASAFARYPYPEAFFTWSRKPPAAPVFYGRSDRYPRWLAASEESNPFPVSMVADQDLGVRLLQRIAIDARAARRYSMFDVELGQSRHQVVALLSYDDPFRRSLKSVFGFLVDMDWVRENYFADLAKQVTRIGGNDAGLQVTIVDGRNVAVVGARDEQPGDVAGRRQFPLLFFDARLVAVNWPDDLGRESWAAYARVDGDPAVAAANVGARRSLGVAAVMAVVVVVGLMVIARTAQASAQLADIRSEFVSTVTHELKTPLATMQAISETLASGRGMTPEISRTYGRLGVHEVKRLRRLIENLLAYSRVADVADVYSFERVDVRGLVDQTVQDFASQLEYGKFEVQLDVPAALPPIRADRKAMGFAVGNLIENALRASPGERYLGIRARAGGRGVLLDVTDRGVGIPADEIPLVTRKFFTGRHGDRSGSGLGLAIVERIVSDHGGSFFIASQVGAGTTVTLDLRVAEA